MVVSSSTANAIAKQVLNNQRELMSSFGAKLPWEGGSVADSIKEKNSSDFLLSFFSSPELKAQVSYSDRLLSVVRLSVCLSVCVNFYIFDFFSRTTGPLLTRLGTNHPWVEGIQVCSNEGDSPSPRGDNSERVKIH
jgi:hypothetical protein